MNLLLSLKCKRFYLFASSVLVLVASISGPPNIGIYATVVSLDINQLITIISSSDSWFRIPDTFLRIILFSSSIVLLLLIPMLNIENESNYKISDNKILLIILLFFITYLSTSFLYNIVAILILFVSIYYYIFQFENNLQKYEILFLLSYLLVFLYPFYHSLYIPSNLAEVDNYLRFFFAIPVYLLTRSIIIRDIDILYYINLISIIIGISAIYYLFFLDDIRVKGFTSTAAIFANISLLFAVLSFFTIKKIYINKKKYIFLPILGCLSALIAWATTGSRGSLIALLILFIFIIFNKNLRNEYLPTNPKFFVLTASAFILIFIQSGSLMRIQNAYESTYNYIYDDSPHHWRHKDSIVPRLNLWDGTMNMVYDNTILGVGSINYNDELNNQIISGKIDPIRNDKSNYTAGMNHAHNQYLDIFAKTGIIGFLTLIYFVIMNYYYFYRNLKNNKENIPGMIGLLVLIFYISYMLYHTILSHQQSILFMTFTLSILAGLSYANKKNIRIKL